MSRNYLILGASSDVGMELVKELNEREKGAHLWSHYYSGSSVINAVRPENGNEILPVQADLSKPDDIRKIISEINASGRIPNVIVHLPAPKLDYIKFKDLKWDDCMKDAAVQAGSIFSILQLLLPEMLKQKYRAKVVFLLSENTVKDPARFSTKYTMSKYMLLGLMKSLTAEYKGRNVNMNALSPSMIDTKLLSNIDRRMLEAAGVLEHMLHPCDVVPHILRLISGESDEMYGENIYLTGKERCVIESVK